MKKKYILLKLALPILFVFTHPTLTMAQTPISVTFSHTGSMQQFTVPNCAGSITVEARGAQGGTGGGNGPTGAYGGWVKGVITATPGTVMYVFAGGQGSTTPGGYNGGGNGGAGSATEGGGGGGASDVRIGGFALSDRVIVAGGGGGGGGAFTATPCAGGGGAGNAFTLASGFGGGGICPGILSNACIAQYPGGDLGGVPAGGPTASGGGGGFTGGGGGGGITSTLTGMFGCPGTLGSGGNGGGSGTTCGGTTLGVNGGGGGGGGYYGGGGGMTTISMIIWGSMPCNSGGAGGSSWCNNTLFSNITYTPGIWPNGNSGHGLVTITYALDAFQMSVTATPSVICSGSTALLVPSAANSYTWNNGSNAYTISASLGSTTSYTVSGTNSVGCVASASTTVFVNAAPPTLSIISSTNNVCPGNTVQLTASGGITNTWSGGVINGSAFSPLSTGSYTASAQNACGTSTGVITITVSPLPVLASINPSVICMGNTTTLSAIGASTYTWLPGNLVGPSFILGPSTNTSYSVIGTYGNCTNTSVVNVNVNPVPSVSVSISPSLACVGSSSTLTANGALSYTWQPGAQISSSIVVTSTATNTYFLVMGTNSFNCSAGASPILNAIPSPTISAISSQSAICIGSSATLSASGANNYLWNTGALTAVTVVNPTTNTVYSVIGTNTTSSCSSTQTVSISVFATTISISPPSSICLGASATLNASGASTYNWNTGANTATIQVSPSISNNYTVTGSNSFGSLTCSTSASTSVIVNPLPIITVTSTQSTICKNESVTLNANGASTYSWSNSGNGTAITVNPLVNTTYSVNGTNINGCVNSASIQIFVAPCTSLSENNYATLNSILLYPNPNHGEFTIKAKRALQLNIINELGQIIRTIDLNSRNNFETQVMDLSNGIYFIESSEKSNFINQKVIVQK